MSGYELRRRTVNGSDSPKSAPSSPRKTAVSQQPEDRPPVESTDSDASVEHQKVTQPLPAIPPENPEERWKKWWRRMWTSLAMIFGAFGYLYATRTFGLVALIVGVQSLVYRELVQIQLNLNKERKLPGFGWFYSYWFGVAVFFMYGGTLKNILLEHDKQLGPLLTYIISNYLMISYVLWMAGFVAFVLSLGSRSLYMYQFSQFGYCHMALLVVVGQSTFLAANVFAGFIWFVIPCGMVVCNDSFAYIFGFFFGKTPLIKLSPKKTWEGFIGGFFATIVWSFWFTRFLQIDAFNDFFTCPHKSFSWATEHCEPTDLFILRPLSYYLPSAASVLIPSVLDVMTSKMMLHAVVMSVFASLVAPFGGFFASGFKRAFKIKDFSDAIPGHGGFTDRMDCQIVIGAFAYVYYNYVVNPTGVLDSVLSAICRLTPQELEVLQQKLNNLTAACA